MLAKTFFVLLTASTLASATNVENWKGTAPTTELTFAGLAGMAIVDGVVGFGMNGYVGKKLLDRGFATDINNQIFIEGMIGPWVLKSSTHLAFGAHLRWDFHKDEDWTFYGLGGFGGFITTSPRVVGGAGGEVYPRFGIGTLVHLASGFALRAELSQSFFGGGVAFSL